MAGFPSLTLGDLSGYSGRPTTAYLNTSYVAAALYQSMLLFRYSTGRRGPDDWPDEAIDQELATAGVLAMADDIYLSQPFQTVLANPMSSETIGSYSYSKAANASVKVRDGQDTGIAFFDLAVRRLCIADDIARVESDSLHVFTDELVWTTHADGSIKVVGPHDENTTDMTNFSISVPIAWDPNTGRG